MMILKIWKQLIQKEYIWSKTEKNENYHQIPQIWISLESWTVYLEPSIEIQ